MFVHQKWVESRLKIPNDIFEEGDDYVTLPPEFYDNMWQPDPYFLNSKIAGNYSYTKQQSTIELENYKINFLLFILLIYLTLTITICIYTAYK